MVEINSFNEERKKTQVLISKARTRVKVKEPTQKRHSAFAGGGAQITEGTNRLKSPQATPISSRLPTLSLSFSFYPFLFSALFPLSLSFSFFSLALRRSFFTLRAFSKQPTNDDAATQLPPDAIDNDDDFKYWT